MFLARQFVIQDSPRGEDGGGGGGGAGGEGEGNTFFVVCTLNKLSF